MTLPVLLALWLANWLVTSSLVVFVVKNRPAETESAHLHLRGLEENLPGLLTWLLLAWPATLLRIVPLVLPLDNRRGGTALRQ
ncbi:hypothetical protein ACF1AE_21205 [Streptomyces sp. NPDC014986]|uniref:hypothetical protein n=1 Tax=Streptomyces sp. NPDC014986 TaxID=3364934 RepID=UPI0036FDB914